MTESLSNAASLIVPISYKDAFQAKRSFMTIRTGTRCPYIARILPCNRYVIVVGYNGEFILYRVDLIEGGEIIKHSEGRLERQCLTMIIP